MSKVVSARTACDAEHAHGCEVDAATVAFSLDGKGYEMDLCRPGRDELHGILRPAAAAGRAIRRRTPHRSMASRRRTVEIRAWAVRQGIAVKPLGRLPGSVIEQYPGD